MQQQADATYEQKAEIASAMLHALGDDELDRAQRLLEELREANGLSEDHPDILVFRVIIAIQRGQALDALQYLTQLGEEQCPPHLRALCLFFIEDPVWQGLATELAENSPDPEVRSSMASLLESVRDTETA
jgi:type III secretion protein HrpB1